jgi:hypothetical protein
MLFLFLSVLAPRVVAPLLASYLIVTINIVFASASGCVAVDAVPMRGFVAVF